MPRKRPVPRKPSKKARVARAVWERRKQQQQQISANVSNNPVQLEDSEGIFNRLGESTAPSSHDANREKKNELITEVKIEDSSDDLISEEKFIPESPTKEEEFPEYPEEPSCSAFDDVEIALLRLCQEKLLLELEKLSEERERIAAEKKNVILRSEILKLRLQLLGHPISAPVGISCDRNNVGSEYFQGNVNVSLFNPSIPQLHVPSMGKPRSSGSALGIQSSLAQLSSGKTAGSFYPGKPLIKISRLTNINSASIHKQSSSTSNDPVSLHPINIQDTVGNLCVLPVTIPCSASRFPSPVLNIGDLSPSVTQLNNLTGIDNIKTSEKSGSSQIGLVLQECNSQQQNVLFAKPASPSTPVTNNTLITASNPPQTDSSKTMLNMMVNSSQLNSSFQLDGSRKEVEYTDYLIVPHSIDGAVEWNKGIVVSTGDSTPSGVLRVKEKLDTIGPSKKLRLSTEDSS